MNTIAALLCLTLGPYLGRSDWRTVEAPFAPSWPRDHGAHLDVRTEWWYATGEFVDDAGREFGFQVTIFRQGLDPAIAKPTESPLRARHALAAHVTLTDLARGTFRHAERLRRMDGGLAQATAHDLDVFVEDVSMRRTADGALALVAAAREQGFELELQLAPAKPLVLHGATGVSRKGPEAGNASAYASWTRLAVTGTLSIDARTSEVRGGAWFDHEWGTSQLGDGVVGWDWTGLRFEDGRELMLYRLRRADGSATPFSAGTLIDADGASTSLGIADFRFEPLGEWESPRTKTRYPLRWRVVVPEFGIEGEIAARLDACEVDARASTGTVYWEGPVRFLGSVAGTGFLELAGYADSLAARF